MCVCLVVACRHIEQFGIQTAVQVPEEGGTSADVSGLYDCHRQQRGCVQRGQEPGADPAVPWTRSLVADKFGTEPEKQPNDNHCKYKQVVH